MQVTYCAGCVLANSKPHCLRWGDWEMGTTINVRGCMALSKRLTEAPQKTFSLCSCHLLEDCMQVLNSPIHPKNVFQMKTSTCRDGTLKN